MLIDGSKSLFLFGRKRAIFLVGLQACEKEDRNNDSADEKVALLEVSNEVFKINAFTGYQHGISTKKVTKRKFETSAGSITNDRTQLATLKRATKD